MQANNTIPTKKKRPSGAEGRRRRNAHRIAEGLLPLPRRRTPVEVANNRDRVRETDRKKIAERRAFIEAYKMERGCVDCGYKAHPAALEYDHLPGTVKTRTVANMAGTRMSMAILLAEIAKCEVVCANCHRIRTINRQHGKQYHGGVPLMQCP